MTISSESNSKNYSGCDYSLSQLLHASKRKLQDTVFGGRIASTANRDEVNALEQDALDVLCLVRAVKNSFVPINRIPPEVLSLIPDHCNDDKDDIDDIDRDLITLTHVCRGWRDVFTSCSSLWTRLDLTNVDKTRTYIQRSQSSPLKIDLKSDRDNDAFPLVLPHLRRLGSLTMNADVLPGVLRHFRCQVPLLEELHIYLYHTRDPILDSALFDGDLSSLRKLTLCGGITITHLPWNNMANLQVLILSSWFPGKNVAQLLDFFESTPLLHTVELMNSIPESSGAPPQRIVPLSHLKALTIDAGPPHSILLNHLRIPTGASLNLRFSFRGERSPLLDYLPEASPNLRNLSHITTIDLHFGLRKLVRLSGPSGSLRVLVRWEYRKTDSHTIDRRILHSLSPSILSTTQRLAVSKYESSETGESLAFRTLSSMDNLRSLTLTKCNNLSFILALNPEENPSKPVLCPKLEEFILYIKLWNQLHIDHLISMAKNRASGGVKLSSITIVGLGGLAPGRTVSKLRAYVADVKYKVGKAPPALDRFPGESSDESNDESSDESSDESNDGSSHEGSDGSSDESV